jgi:RNA polymerase sigma factor (TIGR02999 family)
MSHPAIKKEVSVLLDAWGEGDSGALNDLSPLVHAELCVIARSQLRRERANHTFRTQGLVNEAYLRLCRQKGAVVQNRAHFLGIASRIMRQILVDYARGFQAEKRGGQYDRIYVEDIDGFSREDAVDIVQLNRALEEFSNRDQIKCQIVELRFFGGLTLEETANVMGMSPAKLKREWTFAKAWLLRNIQNQKGWYDT